MTWTDERVEQLKAHNDKGLSATQIAMHMNCGLSRNAVIGKLMRLGIQLKSAKSKSGHPSGAARKPYSGRVRIVRTKPSLDRSALMEAAETVQDIARVALTDLEPHHCRFPVGDPQSKDFGFCGDAKVPGTSYCAGHLHRCTVEVKSKSLHYFKPRVISHRPAGIGLIRELGLVPA